jgi:hypothetical protein
MKQVIANDEMGRKKKEVPVAYLICMPQNILGVTEENPVKT